MFPGNTTVPVKPLPDFAKFTSMLPSLYGIDALMLFRFPNSGLIYTELKPACIG